jgi:hypothetical protein
VGSTPTPGTFISSGHAAPTPRAFAASGVSAAATLWSFLTARAARGFSQSKAMNAASRSHTIMAQKTFVQEPISALRCSFLLGIQIGWRAIHVTRFGVIALRYRANFALFAQHRDIIAAHELGSSQLNCELMKSQNTG